MQAQQANQRGVEGAEKSVIVLRAGEEKEVVAINIRVQVAQRLQGIQLGVAIDPAPRMGEEPDPQQQKTNQQGPQHGRVILSLLCMRHRLPIMRTSQKTEKILTSFIVRFPRRKRRCQRQEQRQRRVG